MSIDYPGMKERCNANFDNACVQYFLTLPRGDLGVVRSRSDFAGSYCNDPKNMNTVPCNLLCRDDRDKCLATRRKYCQGVTLEEVESGERTDCACYLAQEQYMRQIERIRAILGNPTAQQLEVAINSPYCFYGPCASSEAGLASRTGGCQSLSGCIQSVDVGDNKNVVVSNVCNIINSTTPLPSPGEPGTPSPPPVIVPPTKANYSWVWWVILIVIVLLLIVGVLIYRSRRKPATLSPVQLALLAQYT